MPEVSIILPVYNEERHLQKTLSALCTQTFRDFELLAVDDGSTDESRRILERFAAADARITVLAQHHGGPCVCLRFKEPSYSRKTFFSRGRQNAACVSLDIYGYISPTDDRSLYIDKPTGRHL